MGREKRAKLLLPSFVVVVASAYACGGTAIRDSGDEVAGAAGSAGSEYVGGGTSNPPPIFDGGGGYVGGAPNVVVGGSAGTLNPPGFGAPTVCPEAIPVGGSSCGVHFPSGYECNYRSLCGPVVASCQAPWNWAVQYPDGEACALGGDAGAGGEAGAASQPQCVNAASSANAAVATCPGGYQPVLAQRYYYKCLAPSIVVSCSLQPMPPKQTCWVNDASGSIYRLGSDECKPDPRWRPCNAQERAEVATDWPQCSQ